MTQHLLVLDIKFEYSLGILKMLKCFIFIILLTFGSLSFGSSQSELIEIMTWNVENLFDTHHDEGHADWEYTPFGTPGKVEGCHSFDVNYFVKRCLRTNWSNDQLNAKLNNVAKVIRREGKEIPHLLALQEVENEHVLQLLSRKIGYESFELTTGSDKRGINVALLFNETPEFKFVRKIEHEIDSESIKKPTRNILEVQFLVKGRHLLSVFVNHWPSQNNPVNDRLFLAKSLSEIIFNRYISSPNNHYFIALGDFNVNSKDHPNPVRKYILNGTVSFVDVEGEFRKSPTIPLSIKNSIPKGAYFYKRDGVWNKLDKILVDKRLYNGNGPEIILPKFDIYAHPEMVRTYSVVPGLSLPEDQIIPQRFQETSHGFIGASDHFPMSIQIQF